MFELVSYQLFAIEGGDEVMIAKLVKETEEERSSIVGVSVAPKKKGFAGTLEMHVYDKAIIERLKTKLGQKIDVKVVL